MKKVVSLVLVAVLAIGMGMSGFAATVKIKAFATDATLAGPNNDGSALSLGAGKVEYEDYQPSGRVLDLGKVYALDETEYDIHLRRDMFGAESQNLVTTDKTTYLAVDVESLFADAAFFTSDPIDVNDVNIKPTAVKTWADFKAVIETNGKKTNLGTLGAAAADYVKYFEPARGKAGDWYDAWNTAAAGKEHLVWVTERSNGYLRFVDGGEFKSMSDTAIAKDKVFGDQDYITNNDPPTKGSIIDLDDGVLVDGTRNLTSEEIRSNKISFGTTLRAASNAINGVELNRSAGKITVKFAKEWVSTGNKDFEVIIYLTIDGKRQNDQDLTIEGNMRNPELQVYSDHDSVDISKGYVAVAEEFNEKIAVDVGCGATVHTKMFKGKKYYCITTRDSDEDADNVMRQYKDVDSVLTFKNVGLNSSYDRVTLSTDYADYWVYSKDMKLLGRGSESLEFSQKYYLANTKLDIDADDVDEEPDDLGDEPVGSDQDPDMGGDGTSTNVNANPGTGR